MNENCCYLQWDYKLLKDQLISKGLLCILNSSKKGTKQFGLTTMIPQVDLFFVGRILRYQKDISKLTDL